jgi:hypothetical protein
VLSPAGWCGFPLRLAVASLTTLPGVIQPGGPTPAGRGTPVNVKLDLHIHRGGGHLGPTGFGVVGGSRPWRAAAGTAEPARRRSPLASRVCSDWSASGLYKNEPEVLPAGPP